MSVEVETNDEAMQTAIDYYLEHSKVKSNGVREVPKAAFVDRMKTHGVAESEYKKLQQAVAFETTAAANVAVIDLENKVKESSKEDLANEDYRKSLNATVRLPTFGGSTDVEFQLERHVPLRDRETGETSVRIDHGRLRTKINSKGVIHKDFHDVARSRIRAAIGLTD